MDGRYWLGSFLRFVNSKLKNSGLINGNNVMSTCIFDLTKQKLIVTNTMFVDFRAIKIWMALQFKIAQI